MLYILFAALIVLADQLFKGWIVSAIPVYGRMNFIPGLLQLTHVHNEAAAFSLFSGMQLPIIIITCIVCVAIIAALVTRRPQSSSQRFALMLVLGGAVGNLIDRIALGYVIDMFETLFVDFPVFNIADCAIVIGGILFCICILFEDIGKKKRSVLPADENDGEAIMESLKKYSAAEANGDGSADNGDE